MNILLRSALITYLLLIPVVCAQADLVLIVGTANPLFRRQFAASTADVGADGVVTLRETIVDPDRTRGLFWFDIDYDVHQAYLLDDNDGAIVLDLNSGSVVKRCQIPPSRYIGGYEWRVVDPAQGPAFALLRGRAGDKAENYILVGMLADPSIPCSESSSRLRNDQIAGYASAGNAGVGGETPQSPLSGSFEGGRFRTRIGGDWIYFPIELSAPVLKGLGSDRTPHSAAIAVRNRSIEAFFTQNEPKSQGYWARERTGGEWIRLPIPEGHDPNVRGFGSFLAWPESYSSELDAGAKSPSIQASPRPKSAGTEEWRKKDSKWGMSTEYVLTHSSTIHPGVLHIFDVKTARHFTIQTNQADSEVLLIEENSVYYRSNDRLFRCEIRGARLGPAQQIAQSELIRDAHWAFIPKASRP